MHGFGKYSLTDVKNNTSHVTSFRIITSEASISLFRITITKGILVVKHPCIFTVLHGMQTWNSDGNSAHSSVCLSVRPSDCLSNAWIVTKQKKDMSRFLYHMKDHLA